MTDWDAMKAAMTAEQSGHGHMLVQTPDRTMTMQGLINTGCEIQRWYDDYQTGRSTIYYKLPWLVKEEQQIATAFGVPPPVLGNADAWHDQLDMIQACVDDAIAHGDYVATLSSNYKVVVDALARRGMYPREVSEDRKPQDQRTCTIRFAPNPFAAMTPILSPASGGVAGTPGTVTTVHYNGPGTARALDAERPLELIGAKPATKSRPDYFALHEQYVRTGDPKILKRMLAKVNRTSPDLDAVRNLPQPATPELDRLRRHSGDIHAALLEKKNGPPVKMRHRSNVWPVNAAAVVLCLAVMMILLGGPPGLPGLLMLIPLAPNALMFWLNYRRVPAVDKG